MGLLEVIGAAVAAVVAALFMGRHQGRRDARVRAERAYRETREKMDEVAVGDDLSRLRQWLRERGQ